MEGERTPDGRERKAGGSDGLAVAAVRWFGSAALGPSLGNLRFGKCQVPCALSSPRLGFAGMAVTTYTQSRRPVCTSQSTPTQILEFTWKPIVVIVPPVCTLIDV